MIDPKVVTAMKRMPASLIVLGSLFQFNAWASDWPSFRGPNGSGVATAGEFPDVLDPHMNLAWKVDVPAGKSSPVVVGNRIFLTGHDGDQRFVLCYDAKDGRELWRQALQVVRTEHRNKLNDPAAPTIASDGERVFSFFPDFGLVAHTLDGREAWSRPLGPFESQHGVAVSPIYAVGKVFLLVDQSIGSYLAAFDPENGDTIWKKKRQDFVGAFSTPVFLGTELLTVGPGELAAYSTESGDKLWWVKGLPLQPKSVPVIGPLSVIDWKLVHVQGGELSRLPAFFAHPAFPPLALSKKVSMFRHLFWQESRV